MLKIVWIALLIALGLMLNSQEVKAFVPAEVRSVRSIAKWQGRKDLPVILSRVAHTKPVIDQLSRKHGVDPHIFYGLVMTESCCNPFAVDYMFSGGLTHSACVGLGQLNEAKLPKSERKICHLAGLRWQKVHLRRMRLQRKLQVSRSEWLKEAYVNCYSLENVLFAKWVKVDRRFDPRWNLEQTILYFKSNLNRVGWSKSLSIMAHHGGGNDPVRRVIKYARDHEKLVLKPKDVPWYVKSRMLTYEKLYNDYRSPGNRYWALKGDGHLTYAFSPMAGTKVFESYWNGLQPDVRKKIMARGVQNKPQNKPQQVAEVETQKCKMTSAKIAQKDTEGIQKMLGIVGSIAEVGNWFASNANQFVAGLKMTGTGLKMTGVGGGLLIVGGVAVLVILALSLVISYFSIKKVIWPWIIRWFIWRVFIYRFICQIVIYRFMCKLIIWECVKPLLVLASKIAWFLISQPVILVWNSIRVRAFQRA